MASYVGDVMSFYLDNQIQENFVQLARQSNNLFELAYMFGYKPKVTGVATVDIDFFQTVPAKGTGDNVTPNYDYGHRIKEGTVVSADQYGKTFRTVSEVDFSTSGSLDPVTVSIYEVNPSTATPTKYLLKKQARAVSGEVITEQFTF